MTSLEFAKAYLMIGNRELWRTRIGDATNRLRQHIRATPETANFAAGWGLPFNNWPKRIATREILSAP